MTNNVSTLSNTLGMDVVNPANLLGNSSNVPLNLGSGDRFDNSNYEVDKRKKSKRGQDSKDEDEDEVKNNDKIENERERLNQKKEKLNQKGIRFQTFDEFIKYISKGN